MRTFVIVNPEAAGGLSLKRWPRLSDQLYRAIGRFEYEFTNAGGVATLLAAKAVDEGFTRVIAVGGDGTVNEVVNGLLTPDGRLRHPATILGCLPAGSGTDFWKTLGAREDLPAAVRRLGGNRPRPCDIIRVALTGHDGRPIVRYGCNMADVGLGGEVVSRAKRLPAWTCAGNGIVKYLWASAAAFLSWAPVPMIVTVDDTQLLAEPLVIALVANGQYCGGGMRVAPEARLDDGLLNVCCVRPLPKWQFVALLPRLYAGRLGRLPFLARAAGRAIAVTAATPLKVTLDGEVPGMSPARFTLLPKAIPILA